LKTLFPALLFALVSTLAVTPMATAEEMPSATPLFAATLHDLDDKPVALERYKGKPLIVNFWARWCGPCRAEIPELIAIRKAHKGKLEVLGIGIEDKADAAREFAKAYDMDYPVFIARDKGIPLMQALANTKGGLPFTVLIDRNGQVIQKKLGLMKKADLEQAAELLLKGR
jgi:thiol-disulfide isomerase/thioredoxin